MTPAAGAKAVAAGEIDGMAVGRQFLCDPAWFTKLINDEEEEIRPCICCHAACFDLTKYNGSANAQSFNDSIHMCRCALNPESMHYNHYKIEPAKKTKNIAVIGGGVGGMETARVAALRGHKVTIYEKSDKLGGIFIAAAAPEFKENDKELIKWYIHQCEKNPNITIKLNTEVKDPAALGADEIVVATGSAANRIPIKGVDNAVEACDYLLDKKPVGDTVVIVGGGLSGCEIALDLFRKGKKPVIVEMKNDLMAVKDLCLANSSYLRDCFKTNNVPVYLETGVKEIGKDYVIIEKKDKSQEKIACDSVIMSVGYHPTPVAKKSKHVHLVGDCQHVGNLRTVVWGAWDVAMKL